MALAVISTQPSPAQAEFYEGKQIRLIVGSATATTYDLYARLIARFLPKHIPGNPTIIVQIMTGASGMVATNHVFNVAPRDGTVILGAHSSMALAQITDVPNIQYDARQFSFIGRIASGGHDVHYVLTSSSNIKTFGDLLKQEVVVAGTGPTSNSVILPTAINQLMGGKLKIMRGYTGPRRPRSRWSAARCRWLCNPRIYSASNIPTGYAKRRSMRWFSIIRSDMPNCRTCPPFSMFPRPRSRSRFGVRC